MHYGSEVVFSLIWISAIILPVVPDADGYFLVEIDHDVFDLEPAPAMGDLIIVDDIMDTHFFSVGEGESLQKAYKLMRLHKKECLPVVDGAGKLLGIVGVFDIILRMFQEKGIL